MATVVGAPIAFSPICGPDASRAPPPLPAGARRVIPSYLYWQYNDDEDLQAFVGAFNELAQEYVTWLSTVSLPIWTGLSGDLLSWVGEGLYGVRRPVIPTEVPHFIGPINTWEINSLPINGWRYGYSGNFDFASDDIYKRALTWALYRGDSNAYSATWLKRRIARFMGGSEGVDPVIQETYGVSLSFQPGNVVEIRLPGYSDLATVGAFAYLLEAGVLKTPFQYIFNVMI